MIKFYQPPYNLLFVQKLITIIECVGHCGIKHLLLLFPHFPEVTQTAFEWAKMSITLRRTAAPHDITVSKLIIVSINIDVTALINNDVLNSNNIFSRIELFRFFYRKPPRIHYFIVQNLSFFDDVYHYINSFSLFFRVILILRTRWLLILFRAPLFIYLSHLSPSHVPISTGFFFLCILYLDIEDYDKIYFQSETEKTFVSLGTILKTATTIVSPLTNFQWSKTLE